MVSENKGDTKDIIHKNIQKQREYSHIQIVNTKLYMREIYGIYSKI